MSELPRNRRRRPLGALVTFVPVLGASLFALGAGCRPGGSEPEKGPGSAASRLTGAQCDFFDVNGKTQICHKTGSTKNPYTIIKTSVQGCVHGHTGHAGDYITSTDPSSPTYDPTCGGGGCLPESAPCDATLPCCDGLACENGTCVNPCAAHPCENGGACVIVSGNSHVCVCQGGFTGATCETACPAGRGDCDGDLANGCEASYASDVKNCGACRNACPAQAGETATCGAGVCGIDNNPLPATKCTTIQRGRVQGSVQDAEIAASAGATNLGAAPVMRVGTVNGGTSQALLRIDPGPLPPMIQLLSARLTLHVEQRTNDDLLFARAVLVPWSEQTVTWSSFQASASAPIDLSATISGIDPLGAQDGILSFDVGDYAYAVGTGARSNLGIVISQAGSGSTAFSTSESSSGPPPSFTYCYVPDLCEGVTCPPAGPCNLAGTCNVSTGLCGSATPMPNGTSCDDGNPLTTGDVCQGGVCQGSGSGGGYVYPLFAGGPGFACPTGSKVWLSPTVRNPNSQVDAQRACEACYGVGNCYLSSEDGAGPAWGPTSPGQPVCGQAYFGFAAGVTGDEGRAWSMCASSTTYGHWGK